MNGTFKVVLFGDPSVGKTSLLTRILTKSFNSAYISTVGSGCGNWTKSNGVDKTNLQIWDTAGQEKYRSLGRIFFKNAAAGILVVSKEHPQRTDVLDQWYNEFKSHAIDGATVVLCANKHDVSMSTDEIDMMREWAESKGITYIETSAKTGSGVMELFSYVALCVGQNETTYGVSSLPLMYNQSERSQLKLEYCCKG